MRKSVFILFVILLMPLSNVSSEIYKYIDEKGSVVYTDILGKVPEDQRPSLKKHKGNNKHVNGSTEDKRGNVQRYDSKEITSNNSISDKQSDEQLKERMKKAIEEKYGIEVKESCPKETEENIHHTIKSTWTKMSQLMIEGNIEPALTYFSPFSREQNRRKMSDLSDKNLEAIFGSFERIKIESLYNDDGIANCGVVRKESSGTFSYPVRFVRDPDCTWRIQGL